MCWASKKFSSRRHIWAYSKYWQQIPTGQNYPEETGQVTFLTLDPQRQMPLASQLFHRKAEVSPGCNGIDFVEETMIRVVAYLEWAHPHFVVPSQYSLKDALCSKGSVELCDLRSSLPLGSSDDFCGQWGWAVTWGQVSPFSSLLLLTGSGSKSRSVEAEENHPSPRAFIEPTDWTWQADSSSVFSLFLPYDKNGNHGQVGHKAYKILYQNSSSVGSCGAL